MNDHLSIDDQSALLDDQLTASARERALAHLAVCAVCRAEYAQLQEVVDLVRAAPLRPLPEGVDLRLSPSLLAPAAETSDAPDSLPRRQSKRGLLSQISLPRPGAFALGGFAAVATVTLALGLGWGLWANGLASDEAQTASSGATHLTEADVPAVQPIPQRQPASAPAAVESIAMAESEAGADSGATSDEAAEEPASFEEGAVEGEAEGETMDEVMEEAEEEEPAMEEAESAAPAERADDLRARGERDNRGEDDLEVARPAAAPSAAGPPLGASGLALLATLVLVLGLFGFFILRRRG